MSLIKKMVYYAGVKNSFLSFELGWCYLTPSELRQFFNKGKIGDFPLVFLVGAEKKEIDLVREFPPASVWLLPYGDETFSPLQNFRLIKNRSTKGIVRPYPFPRFGESTPGISWTRLWHSYIRIEKSSVYTQLKTVIQAIWEALIILLRQFAVFSFHKIFRKPVIMFTPGYTNLFYDSFVALRNIPFGSRILDRNRIVSTMGKRDNFLVFTGQSGRIWRQIALDKCRNIELNKVARIIENSGFGGTPGANGASSSTGRSYVQNMLGANFVLCPPGNYSSATFRWLESVCCGALPIEICQQPADPIYVHPFLFDHNNYALHDNWDSALTYASELTVAEKKSILSELISQYESFLTQVSETLHELQIKSR